MEQRITAPKGCKIDSVEHDNNSVVIMFSEDKEVRTWDDLFDKVVPSSSVFFEGEDAALLSSEYPTFSAKCKGLFIDEKHAKSALAMAQISQLMPYYGGAITDEEWKRLDYYKHIITRSKNKIEVLRTDIFYHFLAFGTREHLDNFLKYNERLVKDYLMLD